MSPSGRLKASKDLVLTYDCGTTSVKAAAIDLSGTVLAHANGTYPLHRAHPEWAEQDPELLWSEVSAAGQRALSLAGPAAARRVAACVFVAPWKAIIPLDKQGRVLAAAITWLDDRAAELRTRLSDRFQVSAGNGADYWSKLVWLREHRPEVWAAAEHLVGLNTYFKFRATGELVTESSDDFIHPPATAASARYAKVLPELGLAEQLFAPSRASSETVGHVSRTASVDLGVDEGTPVINGFGDLPAITIGAGRAAIGDAHIYVGTSSWLVSVTEPDAGLGAAFDFTVDSTRSCVAVGALQSACLALDWITAQTYRAEQAALGPAFWDFLNEEIAQVPPAMDGVIGTHWLSGEPSPIGWQVRASFTGLSTAHDRRHMVRAVMESIAMTHRLSWQRLVQHASPPVRPLRIVGGGASSDVWLQIFADVLGVEIEAPSDPRYTGTRGAYFCAMVGLGLSEDYAQASAIHEAAARRFSPDTRAASHYEEVFSRYVHLPELTRSLHTAQTT